MCPIGFQLQSAVEVAHEGSATTPLHLHEKSETQVEKLVVRGGRDGIARLEIEEGMTLIATAGWLAERSRKHPGILPILNAMVSNAITIATHVPQGFSEAGAPVRAEELRIAVVEDADGDVTLLPGDEAELRLAVWSLGLAGARHATALNLLSKLVRSAEKLAELSGHP
jgi:hypothetical protein